MVGPAYVVVMGRCDWQVKGHSIRLLIITAIWGSRETVLGELKTVLSSSVHVNPMRSPWNTGNTGLVDLSVSPSFVHGLHNGGLQLDIAGNRNLLNKCVTG